MRFGVRLGAPTAWSGALLRAPKRAPRRIYMTSHLGAPEGPEGCPSTCVAGPRSGPLGAFLGAPLQAQDGRGEDRGRGGRGRKHSTLGRMLGPDQPSAGRSCCSAARRGVRGGSFCAWAGRRGPEGSGGVRSEEGRRAGRKSCRLQQERGGHLPSRGIGEGPWEGQGGQGAEGREAGQNMEGMRAMRGGEVGSLLPGSFLFPALLLLLALPTPSSASSSIPGPPPLPPPPVYLCGADARDICVRARRL